MKIDHYTFGEITIDGRTYHSDVIIYPDHVDPSWWRKEGHFLYPEDLDGPVRYKPELLVIGTGYSGSMRVPEETINFLRSKGIEVHVDITRRAVEFFNNNRDRKIVAALHLTC